MEVSDGELKEGKFTFTGQSNRGASRSVFSISETGSYESSSYMKGQALFRGLGDEEVAYAKTEPIGHLAADVLAFGLLVPQGR